MSKKIISLILTLVMALGMFTITAIAADAPSSWATEQVSKAIETNLVPFSLQSAYTQATTRAEFCALAVAVYENVKGAITGRTTFVDTTDINVEKAASIGVVTGVGNNKFDPDAKLTREQAAVMLSRLADTVGKPFPMQAAAFADNSKVSSWALDGVGQVQAAGIMGGVGGNTFAPHDPYTREQSIVTILRTFDAVKGGLTTEPVGTIDKALVGKWVCDKVRQIQKQVGTEMSMVSEMVQDYYQFFDDGTFLYIPYGERFSCYEGNYSASNGKFYLTNVVRRHTETDEILTNLNVSDKIEMKYEILKDGEGEYLHVASLTAFRDSTTVDLSRADMYRKK